MLKLSVFCDASTLCNSFIEFFIHQNPDTFDVSRMMSATNFTSLASLVRYFLKTVETCISCVLRCSFSFPYSS